MKSNILYVDDEPENIVVFEAAFEDLFNISTANSAEEALQLTEESYFPVIVSDQRMPGMTGAELFEILRERHPFSKRIVLTAYSDTSTMMDAINKAGVYQFVTKPWNRESLAPVLMRAVEPRPEDRGTGVNMAIESLQRAMDLLDSIEDVPRGSNLMCSRHGVSPSIYDSARNRQLTAIDRFFAQAHVM